MQVMSDISNSVSLRRYPAELPHNRQYQDGLYSISGSQIVVVCSGM